MLDCPATTVVELVEWTLHESGLGVPKLNRYGKDSDPLTVLTAAAAMTLGSPSAWKAASNAAPCVCRKTTPVSLFQLAAAAARLT